MAKDPIDYEAMAQTALRDVVKKTISYTEKHGLLGNHHFYITFATEHPGVEVPDYLRDQYGDEITIVLQYEFWDLVAESKGFYVTLCFDDAHEKLYVPYTALLSFVDPSVKFGLQFNPVTEEHSEVGKVIKGDKPSDKVVDKLADKSGKIKEKNVKAPKGGSNIVTLDSFRKK